MQSWRPAKIVSNPGRLFPTLIPQFELVLHCPRSMSIALSDRAAPAEPKPGLCGFVNSKFLPLPTEFGSIPNRRPEGKDTEDNRPNDHQFPVLFCQEPID